MKIRHGSHFAGYSSHCPMLIKTMEITDKMSHPARKVLELGAGLFSTPLLHWLCFDQGRKLVSYDNNPQYMKIIKRFRTDWHEIHSVDNWDKIPIEEVWSVALIDHAPAERRSHDIDRLANYAICMVVHDTDSEYNESYGYQEVFDKFQYRYDYTKCSPNTTVLSNFIDLGVLGD